jgi:hypothetical protein
MDNSIKTIIELNNTSNLISEFSHLIATALPVVFPVSAGIGLTFFLVRVFRRFIHV